jgi:hypothetical protein
MRWFGWFRKRKDAVTLYDSMANTYFPAMSPLTIAEVVAANKAMKREVTPPEWTYTRFARFAPARKRHMPPMCSFCKRNHYMREKCDD